MALRPEECNKVARPSFACIVSCVKTLSSKEKRLYYAPMLWQVAFDDLEPAQLGGRIRLLGFLGFVRVGVRAGVGQEPFLDAIYNGASKVGYSGCVFEVSDELVTPSCPRVVALEVQVRYGLGLYILDIPSAEDSVWLLAGK
jgi:hypothetical protein